MTRLNARLALTAILCAVSTIALGQVKEPGKAPDYVGSRVCISCHHEAGDAWIRSHHAKAWNEPTDRSVLGDFNDKTFGHGNVISRFSKDEEKFFVSTDGPGGRLQTFEVVGTVGTAPLQQYLVETKNGHLQALDIAWDTKQQRWYHLYPDQKVPHTNGLHWTGPYKNWQARCAECHATGFEKRYAPLTRRYSTRQKEIGVGCEACHGPGSAHIAWTKDRDTFDPTAWDSINAVGFTAGFDRKNAEVEIQQCAGCHSRREPIGDITPIPGTPFHDSYHLALLSDGLYHADGQIRDEVYVYGSFLQSKMYARGVRCTDCHNAHDAGLKAKGNAVCVQCHSPNGNPSFPTLRRAKYNDSSHHFHEAGSLGAQCKSCHMIQRVYMGIDGRRDHSFRVPRPDLSVALGTPNACTDCHKDKSAEWAAGKVAAKFPENVHRGDHYASAFAAARQGRVNTAVKRSLLEIATSHEHAGIARATALDLLRPYATPEISEHTANLLQDQDPLVRAAATALQRGAPANIRLKRVGPRLQDEHRSVRIAAVRAILDILASGGPPELASSARRAIGEYQQSLTAKADFPEVQMAIAGTALVFRDFRMAERAFSEAVRMDPQRTDAWAMIARLRSARGNIAGATNALRDGLAANPSDPNLTKLLRDLR